MSRLYFHSPSGQAELAGAERHHLGKLVKDLARGMFDTRGDHPDRLITLAKPGHWLHNEPRHGLGCGITWPERFHVAWNSSFEDDAFNWRGRNLNTHAINLNTAIAAGSDPMRLAARLDGQCEIHAWVDGPNRAWLADIIDEGLKTGLFRRVLHGHPLGWESVTELLRARDDEPVVTSYSVCEGFPDDDQSTFRPERPDGWIPPFWEPEEWDALSTEEQWGQWIEQGRGDLWDRLGKAERWRYSMEWLRGSPALVEMRPDNWVDYYFDHGLTVFDLNAQDMERRLDEALGLTPLANV